MARLSESPANGASGGGSQPANKHQITLKNGALGGFLSSPAKPSGSQSPHANKRLKSLTSPRSDASRSLSPVPRLPGQAALSSPVRKAFGEVAPAGAPGADEMDTSEDRGTPADVVISAPAAETPVESTPTPTAATADMATSDAEKSAAATPEPVVPRPVGGVVSSVSKKLTNVFNNFTGARNGTASVTTTFEQTIVSRKRSREPEAEETPAPLEETPAPAEKETPKEKEPAEKEIAKEAEPVEKDTAEKTEVAEKQTTEEPEPADVTMGANDTNIELGNQLEEDVAAERAKSPVKESLPPAPRPTSAAGEISVTTDADNADTIQAAETTKPAPKAAPKTAPKAAAKATPKVTLKSAPKITLKAKAAPKTAPKPAPEPAAEDEDETMVDDPEKGLFVLDTIIGHRKDPKDKTLFQMHVRWKHDEPSWEPESNIQEDAEEALFEYWDSVKGGRLGAMADKDLWHVLRVEKHKQKPTGKVELYVAWTGSPDRSWEPEENVTQFARELVEDYWASKGGRDKVIKPIAAPAKRGRGRPRKESVVEDAPKAIAKAAPKAKAKEVKEAEEPAPKKPRAGRKKVPEEAETPVEAKEAATKSAEPEKASEQTETDGEPPKKRGRGRPKKTPVS
ncbi:hypothetical protein CGCSCA1_v006755 [Colletotrichum siamense]|nr:hypothetical protein CGCSCA1_v006755 [Colletotrichum siamense]